MCFHKRRSLIGRLMKIGRRWRGFGFHNRQSSFRPWLLLLDNRLTRSIIERTIEWLEIVRLRFLWEMTFLFFAGEVFFIGREIFKLGLKRGFGLSLTILISRSVARGRV